MEWRPFTSEDIDLKGNRHDAVRIARQLGLVAHLPGMIGMTALAGVIPFKLGDLSATIEIVRTVPSVTDKAVEATAVSAVLQGQQIRVLDPISLLASKADLATTVSQKSRRDVDHLKIMLLCVRAFLRESLKGVEEGQLPLKGWMGAVERTLTLSETTLGRKTARRFGIRWIQVLPEAEIEACANPKVIQFRQKRLPRWRERIGRHRLAQSK